MAKDRAKIDEDGGLGGMCNKVGTNVSDVRMIERAIRERWPIPAEKRPIIVEKMTKIVETDTNTVLDIDGNSVEVSNARNQTAAARVLAQLDAMNQADEHLAEKHERLDGGKATENVATTFRLEFDERDTGA